MTARSLRQCDDDTPGPLAKGGKSCGKVFCCADDLSEHLLDAHKSRNWNAFCVVLYIDVHEYLYMCMCVVHVYLYVCMCVDMHVHVYLYMCMRVHMHMLYI